MYTVALQRHDNGITYTVYGRDLLNIRLDLPVTDNMSRRGVKLTARGGGGRPIQSYSLYQIHSDKAHLYSGSIGLLNVGI